MKIWSLHVSDVQLFIRKSDLHNKIHQWLRSALIIFQVCKHASKQGAALKGLELQQHEFSLFSRKMCCTVALSSDSVLQLINSWTKTLLIVLKWSLTSFCPWISILVWTVSQKAGYFSQNYISWQAVTLCQIVIAMFHMDKIHSAEV